MKKISILALTALSFFGLNFGLSADNGKDESEENPVAEQTAPKKGDEKVSFRDQETTDDEESQD